MIYSIHKVSTNGDVCIVFPYRNPYSDWVPEEVSTWAEKTINDPYWWIQSGKRAGIYLNPADAVAFKLKFG